MTRTRIKTGQAARIRLCTAANDHVIIVPFQIKTKRTLDHNAFIRICPMS